MTLPQCFLGSGIPPSLKLSMFLKAWGRDNEIKGAMKRKMHKIHLENI